MRGARERFYIEKTQTLQPQGINREDDYSSRWRRKP